MIMPKAGNLQKIKLFIKELLYSERLSFDAKMTNFMGLSGVFAAVAAAIIHIIAGSDATLILILIAVSITVCVLIYFINRLKMYEFAIIFALIFVGNILYPIVFFFSGGINGPTTYFVLTITLIFLLTKGRILFLLLTAHCLAISGCFYIASVKPDWIVPISVAQKNINDITAIFISGLLLGIVIIYQRQLFSSEQEKVENANIKLNKQDILLRSMNEASAILLTSDSSEFLASFDSGISCIAGGIGANKSTIWKIEASENGNIYKRIYEWEKTRGLLSDDELYMEEDILAGHIISWDGKLGSDEHISWHINSAEKGINSEIKRAGVQAFLVIPVFISDNYWGAISFIDMNNAREYSHEEINFARSGSLIIVNAFNRDCSIKDLVDAREKALAGTHAKTNFLSNMSHEIRTPMNAIIGMTTMAKLAEDAERKNYCLHKIEDASIHLLGLLNDILDMSKIEADKFELSNVDFYFEKVLQKAVNIISYKINEKSHKLSIQIDKHIPQALHGDDNRLLQVITNLLSNAVKFTPENGSVTVKAELVNTIEGKCNIRISVTDTGIGISSEQHKKLFSAFQQADSSTSRKFGGTGLGLAISKRIIEAMGGQIWVESELGMGSTFSFEVELETVIYNQSEIPVYQSKEKLLALVVDDDADNRKIWPEIIYQLNLNCEIVNSGEAACRLIEAGNSYDIFFIGRSLPAMDGIALTKHIKASAANDPLLVMIINRLQDIEPEAKAAGVCRFISKPLFMSDIADCINTFFAPEAAPADEIVFTDNCFAGHHILLAEDVEINREIVIAMLEPSGLTISCAKNGLEALNMVENNPDKYDLILMDIQMPEMDGVDATKNIRALKSSAAKIPVIALTANVFNEDIEKYISAGMNTHLGKPFEYDEMIKLLGIYLPSKQNG